MSGVGPLVAILLAAGESARMGRPKPLLTWAGTTLLEWQIEQLREAGASEVIVVLGSRAEEVEPVATAAGATVVLNPDYREGRASSLRAGAAAVHDNAAAIVILGVDQPRPAWVTRRLIERRRENGPAILIPAFEGHRGHPVVLSAALLGELRAVNEASLGLRAVTERHQAETETVEIDNSSVIVDLNTPSEYEDALRAFNNGDWREE